MQSPEERVLIYHLIYSSRTLAGAGRGVSALKFTIWQKIPLSPPDKRVRLVAQGLGHENYPHAQDICDAVSHQQEVLFIFYADVCSGRF